MQSRVLLVLCGDSELCLHEGSELASGESAIINVFSSVPPENCSQKLDVLLTLLAGIFFSLLESCGAWRLQAGSILAVFRCTVQQHIKSILSCNHHHSLSLEFFHLLQLILYH